jgi:hypothetical protein
MSPLWSDMALARAALASIEEQDSVTHLGKAKPCSAEPASRKCRRIRRVPRPRLSSFAL